MQAVVVHLNLHPVQAARQLAQRALGGQRLSEGAQQACPLSCYVGLLLLQVILQRSQSCHSMLQAYAVHPSHVHSGLVACTNHWL